MSNKPVPNLPSASTPWIKSKIDLYHSGDFINSTYAKATDYSKHFGFSQHIICLSKVFTTVLRAYYLCQLNDYEFFKLSKMKEYALEYSEQLDILFEEIKQNKQISFYYNNIESAFIQDALDIIKQVLEAPLDTGTNTAS